MGRYLIVTWDGAGNLAPTLGITRTLVDRGHDVRLLGHDTIAERCADTGARFVPLSQGEGWDAMDDPDDFEAEMKLMIEDLCFSSAIAGGPRQGARPGAGGRGAGRLHAVHGHRRRAGPRRPDGHAVPHAVHDLPRRSSSSRCSRRAWRSRTRTARSSACRRSSDSATSTTPARARSSRCRRSSSPTRRTPPTCCASDRCSTHLRWSATSTRSTSATGPLPLVLVSLSTSEQGQADLLQRASTRSRSCPCAPSSRPARRSTRPPSAPAPTPRWCATCRTPRCCPRPRW